MDRDEARYAAALLEFGPHQVAGTLWRDHDDIDIPGRNDRLEVNVEAVSKAEGLARPQIGGDGPGINAGLEFIRQRHADQVGLLHHFFDAQRLKAHFHGQFRIACAGHFRNDDLDAGIPEIGRMGVALGTKAQDADGFAGQAGEGGIFLVKYFQPRVRHNSDPCKKRR
jgi:hypothetical protein